MNGLAEEPRRPQLLVERNHRRQTGDLVEQVEQRLHEVVGLHRAAGHVDDRQAGLRFPIPAEVVGQAHAAGGVAFHGVDAAVGGAGSACNDGQRLGRQAVDPLVGGDGLAGVRIGAQGRPVAFFLDLLVGDRAFHDEHERIEPARLGLVPELHEVVAILVGEDGIVQVNLGQAGNCAEHHIFDAGLRGRGDGDGVAVATQTGRDP